MNNDLHIERLWLNNSLRNYNYIAVCKKSNEALVIDPYDVDQILNTINNNKWNVKAVVNTHDHNDHIEGNDAVIKATGASLLAPANANINHVDQWLNEGDKINLGESIVFDVLDTAGHTLPHISLLSNTTVPELLCGDTIFNAGAGNVYSGDAAVLFESFEKKISNLAHETRIYPGHDYMQTNLNFTLKLEPENLDAAQLLEQCNQLPPERQIITNIGQEKLINTFLRLEQKQLLNSLTRQHPDLGEQPSRKDVFLKLRELRNQW